MKCYLVRFLISPYDGNYDIGMAATLEEAIAMIVADGGKDFDRELLDDHAHGYFITEFEIGGKSKVYYNRFGEQIWKGQ